MGDISRETAAKQMSVGGVLGIATGLLFVKVGHTAAVTLGTTVLVVQVARHNGGINFNWDNVESEIERRAQNLLNPGFFNNVKRFVKNNIFLSVGFGGGFLVSMAV